MLLKSTTGGAASQKSNEVHLKLDNCHQNFFWNLGSPCNMAIDYRPEFFRALFFILRFSLSGLLARCAPPPKNEREMTIPLLVNNLALNDYYPQPLELNIHGTRESHPGIPGLKWWQTASSTTWFGTGVRTTLVRQPQEIEIGWICRTVFHPRLCCTLVQMHSTHMHRYLEHLWVVAGDGMEIFHLGNDKTPLTLPATIISQFLFRIGLSKFI